MSDNIYLCIDLKSFYASVECVERGLDPMTTNLVVADSDRTEKTICLAVSPSLKKYGISGRARLFEVVQKVKEENNRRRKNIRYKEFSGSSVNDIELMENNNLKIDYIVAPPRMAHYIEHSTEIYKIYLKYISPEDIHVYSIDEVFIDLTKYLSTYNLTPRQLAMKIIKDVLKTTGITSTAGIGTNMYLAKIAMDIVAKHIKPDKYGVRIAELDEMSYRKQLWGHTPITDFWRVGKGYAKKLAEHGLFTMGDIARCSLGKTNDYYNEDLLYKLFGINAELLVDHAWGWECCTIADIKAYKPLNTSICSGQVLQCPYKTEQARLVIKEIADNLALELVDKELVINQIVITVGYDIENLHNPDIKYTGEIVLDPYGRSIPKNAHGTINMEYTSSTKTLVQKALELYDKIINPKLLIRRMNITANHLQAERDIKKQEIVEQLDLFTDYAEKEREENKKMLAMQKEKQIQHTLLDIKKKFGKNAILKGMNLTKDATGKDRNNRIGGHKA